MGPIIPASEAAIPMASPCRQKPMRQKLPQIQVGDHYSVLSFQEFSFPKKLGKNFPFPPWFAVAQMSEGDPVLKLPYSKNLVKKTKKAASYFPTGRSPTLNFFPPFFPYFVWKVLLPSLIKKGGLSSFFCGPDGI